MSIAALVVWAALYILASERDTMLVLEDGRQRIALEGPGRFVVSDRRGIASASKQSAWALKDRCDLFDAGRLRKVPATGV
jgi:hypothetical protein